MGVKDLWFKWARPLNPNVLQSIHRLLQNAHGKATKDSVVVSSFNGRLQLSFRVNGKRYYLSTGYPDTEEYRKLAEAKARLAQADTDLGRFDPTLDRYRPQSAPLAAVGVTPISIPKTQLSELWELYTEFRRSQIAQTTFRIQYAAIASHIRRLPTQSLEMLLKSGTNPILLDSCSLRTSQSERLKIQSAAMIAYENLAS